MAETASAPERDRIWRHVLAVFVALAAFVAGCWAIRAAMPFPNVPALGPKYRHLAAHRDRYDMLFVGSSRFYHHIIPAEFDAAVEKLTGFRPRSFNAAYDAVWPPESYYFLRKLLALRLPRLRWVVIDAMNINVELKEQNRHTQRMAYWHDLAHTCMAWEAIFDPKQIFPLQPSDQRAAAWEHLTIFGKEAVNLGRGAGELAPRLGVRKTKVPKPPEWSHDEGFFPGRQEGMTGKSRTDYLAAVEALHSQTPLDAPPSLMRALEKIIADVRAAGAEPIFVITPTINENENFRAIPGGATLIKLNEPQKHPALFEPELHYDPWHLNEKGAHVFTQILAEQLAPRLIPPPPR